MTFAFALITVGLVLVRSGWTNRNIAETLRSEPPPAGTPSNGTNYAGDDLLPSTDAATASAVRAVGTVQFDGKPVAAWIVPILKYGRSHGWTGKVNSGYRSRAEQERIYASGVRPAAKPGTSNHEGIVYPRGAVDVSNAEQLSAILLKSPYAKVLVFAGAKDPVHFSHPHNGSY